MLNRGNCPICGDVIVGDHRWKYVCRNCSLRFDFSIIGMFLVRSKNINESINKDLVRAALTCKHLEVVIIKDGEDDNSSMIKEFLDECEMKDYNISIVNNAPQKETTAYLVYEACPTANVIFGEKGRVYGLMITKHNLIAWNHPSMDEVNRKIDTVLSKSSSDSTD